MITPPETGRPDKLRTWIEVSRLALESNLSAFRSLLQPGTLLAGVVKSNAYGHDFIQVAQELVKNGIDYLAVDSIVEARRLRREKITLSILVLGYTLPEKINAAIADDL